MIRRVLAHWAGRLALAEVRGRISKRDLLELKGDLEQCLKEVEKRLG